MEQGQHTAIVKVSRQRPTTPSHQPLNLKHGHALECVSLLTLLPSKLACEPTPVNVTP